MTTAAGPPSADDIITAMEPMCPDMTVEERAARPLLTIDNVAQLACPVCGQTARRIRYVALSAGGSPG